MKRSVYETKSDLKDMPGWYWSHGLHDAKILQVNQKELNYDYKFCNPRRNCIELILDASGAIYDKGVRALRFYNYKLISGNPEIAGQWWMCDLLRQESGKYRLKITTNDSRDDYELAFQFEDAEIEK